MSYFNKPILVMFLGLPGSGKSYFARHLADSMGAVRLSSDAMRLCIFETKENIEQIYNSKNRIIVNNYVFNAMDYATEQILIRGQDVIYDAHSNRKKDRSNLVEIAKRYNALPILVLIKTPYEVALQRGQDRDETLDQRKLSKELMREVMDRHQSDMDLPDITENVIEIDGQVDYAEQLNIFHNKVQILLGKSTDE